jgi:hypothetical protein
MFFYACPMNGLSSWAFSELRNQKMHRESFLIRVCNEESMVNSKIMFALLLDHQKTDIMCVSALER